MGTTRGADELGLCSRRHACQAGAWGRHHLRVIYDMAIFDQNQKWSGRQKYSVRLIILFHDEILTDGILRVNCGTLQMQIPVSFESIAQRARELLA